MISENDKVVVASKFIGSLTMTVLAALPTAEVEWSRDEQSDTVAVSVKWHEPERARSVADPPRGGTYVKVFPAAPFSGDAIKSGWEHGQAIVRSLTGD